MRTALACATWLALGLPCAALFWRRGRRELAIALLPFAGALALTLPVALAPWLDGSLAHWTLRAALCALLLAGCAALLLRGIAPVPPSRGGPVRGAFSLAALAIASLLLVATGATLAADGWPGYGWDGLSIWLVRAKVLAQSAELPAALFREPQLVQGHWDYPLLLPALLAWFARFADLEVRQLALALGVIAACFVPAQALGLWRTLPAPAAVALALAPLAVPGLAVTHFNAYADPLLVFASTAGFAWSAQGAIRRDGARVAAGGLALARAAGAPHRVALGTCLRCALPGLAVFALWRATCTRLGVPDTLPSGLRFDLLEARGAELAAALRDFLGAPQHALVLAACIGAAIALAGGGVRTRAARVAALLAAPALYGAGLAVVYLATPHALDWHLATSLPRTAFGLAPACLVAALLAPILAATAPGPRHTRSPT